MSPSGPAALWPTAAQALGRGLSFSKPPALRRSGVREELFGPACSVCVRRRAASRRRSGNGDRAAGTELQAGAGVCTSFGGSRVLSL